MVDGINSYNQYVPNFGNGNPGLYKGLQGAAVANSNDINNLARYTLGTQQVHEETLTQSVTGTIPFMGIFGAIQAFPWLKKNYKHPFQAISADKAAYLSNPANNRYGFRENAKEILLEHKNKLFKGLTDAEKVALQQNRGFLGKTLDLIPGYKKLRVTGFGQMMGKSGAGWMIAIDGGVKLFTEIIPTFKELGTGSGLKQVGKSSASVASAAAGWTVGEIAGSAAGVAIGTALCPGVGTVAGKFIGGFLGGTIGMFFAHKATTAVVGKSELELNKEAKAAQVTQQAQSDPQAQLQLAQQARSQAMSILETDPENKEALEAKVAAEKIMAGSNIDEANPQSIDQKADAAEAQYNQVQTELANTQMPQFGGLTAGLNVPPVPGFDGQSFDMNTYNQAISKASLAAASASRSNYLAKPLNMTNPIA